MIDDAYRAPSLLKYICTDDMLSGVKDLLGVPDAEQPGLTIRPRLHAEIAEDLR